MQNYAELGKISIESLNLSDLSKNPALLCLSLGIGRAGSMCCFATFQWTQARMKEWTQA